MADHWAQRIDETIEKIEELPGGEGWHAEVKHFLQDAEQWVKADPEMQILRAEAKVQSETHRAELLDALKQRRTGLNVEYAITVLERQRW
jgi:hypothetical protein